MCDLEGFDLEFGPHGILDIKIVPHFCRCIDCGGGMSFEEAKKELLSCVRDRLEYLKEEIRQVVRAGTYEELPVNFT
jgi:hypothetical protein